MPDTLSSAPPWETAAPAAAVSSMPPWEEAAAAKPKPGFFEELGNKVSETGKGIATMAGKTLGHMAEHPVANLLTGGALAGAQTVGDVLKSNNQQQGQLYEKAKSAFQAGDIPGGMGHLASVLGNTVPGFGSAADEIGSKWAAGDRAGAAADATFLLGTIAGPGMVKAGVSALPEAAELVSALKAGAKAAAPDVAIGTGKIAGGAAAGYVGGHVAGPYGHALGAYPAYAGVKQVIQGVGAGVDATKAALADNAASAAIRQQMAEAAAARAASRSASTPAPPAEPAPAPPAAAPQGPVTYEKSQPLWEKYPETAGPPNPPGSPAAAAPDPVMEAITNEAAEKAQLTKEIATAYKAKPDHPLVASVVDRVMADRRAAAQNAPAPGAPAAAAEPAAAPAAQPSSPAAKPTSDELARQLAEMLGQREETPAAAGPHPQETANRALLVSKAADLLSQGPSGGFTKAHWDAAAQQDPAALKNLVQEVLGVDGVSQQKLRYSEKTKFNQSGGMSDQTARALYDALPDGDHPVGPAEADFQTKKAQQAVGPTVIEVPPPPGAPRGTGSNYLAVKQGVDNGVSQPLNDPAPHEFLNPDTRPGNLPVGQWREALAKAGYEPQNVVGRVATRVQPNGKVISENVMTHPDFQRQGIASKLYDEAGIEENAAVQSEDGKAFTAGRKAKNQPQSEQ